MTPLDWLLEDDNPGVQLLARTRILGESPISKKLVALRKRCNEYAPTDQLLDRVDKAVAAGDYKKYEGAYWSLIFLADLFAAPPSKNDARVVPLAEHVLKIQLDNGGFGASGTPGSEIVCLTANLLRALVHFGYGDDERVIAGYERLAERILPHEGVPCIALQYSLHTACKMTLPQTLRCLAAAPPGVNKSKLKRLRELLVRQLLEVRVFHYVRPDVKEYHAASARRPKGVAEKTIRLQWLEDHPVPVDEWLPKPGWKRFGFPRSYNPDLLEGMLALAELGVPYDSAMDDALDHIERKRGKDGRWKLDDSLNGKMLTRIELKGKPSKWITLRAMTVLKQFGRD